MSIKQILTFDGVPKGICEESYDSRIAVDLYDTAMDTESCAGLAAPQIGVLARIIVVKPKAHMTLVMMNPVVESHGRDVETQSEGCLSYPGRSREIERYRVITVAYAYPEAPRRITHCTFKGFVARVIQHEIDHLDGLCKVAGENTRDDLFDQAVEAVRLRGIAKVIDLQREFHINFFRANRLIEQMGDAGFLEERQGCQGRKWKNAKENIK